MTARDLSRVAIAVLIVSSTAIAQVGHPAKGSWLGYYGPDAGNQRRIRLLLDWEDRQVVGVINPGRSAVEISRVAIDYETWTMTIETDELPMDGKVARFVATGTMDNLGSWTKRRYRGSYTHGTESGEFEFFIN